MFRLEDLLDQVYIQGKINIKQITEDDIISVFESDDFESDESKVPKNVKKMSVEYMYTAANTLQIEVKEEN